MQKDDIKLDNFKSLKSEVARDESIQDDFRPVSNNDAYSPAEDDVEDMDDQMFESDDDAENDVDMEVDDAQVAQGNSTHEPINFYYFE